MCKEMAALQFWKLHKLTGASPESPVLTLENRFCISLVLWKEGLCIATSLSSETGATKFYFSGLL